MASLPTPAVPNWCSTRSGEQTSSTTAVSPVAKPSSNIRRIASNAADRL
jgi:hypothetical protein